MTYITGGDIQASDYNTFSTATLGMNQIFADLYPGATTLPNAGYGYGQTPPLTSVSIGDNVTAAQWTALFQTIRKCGTHQDPAYPTGYVPPLPAADPVIGDDIVAHNTPSILAPTLASLITLLGTNRFNISPGQSLVTTGTNPGWAGTQVQSSGAWTNSLTFTFQIDFGSWNNARYFFNSGGQIRFAGAYAPIITPEDAGWAAVLTSMSNSTILNYNSTTSAGGNTSPTPDGFYGLTNIYKTVYIKKVGGAPYYYANNDLTIQARIGGGGPGLSGLLDLSIIMTDNDVWSGKEPKSGITTYTLGNRRSAGSIPIPLPPIINPQFISA